MKQIPAGELLAQATQRLSSAGIDSARLDARILLAHTLGARSDSVFSGIEIDASQADAFESLIARRVSREPVAYITGKKEFFSLEFEVGPGVLIPRPETETLVEEALRAFPDRHTRLDVLDFGTGSGCLIVAFLAHYANAHGLAVDSSPEALVWAARNVERHKLSSRCSIRAGDWNATGVFDVIFANPPYLTNDEFEHAAPEIGLHEPEAAFIAGCDGLAAYRVLAPVLAGSLKPDGLVFLEVGAGQAHAVTGILERHGLEARHSVPDLAGIARCLIAGRLG
jgi:release factor glutamine methyltransferase